MIYLLDTNVVAEITTRPKPAPAVVAWARSVPAPALHLSVITIAEIEAGIEGTRDLVRRTAFERALTDVRERYRDRIAAIGEREALAYLALHRRLKSAGTSIDPPDALIAATALTNGWTLVSRNTKHLARSGALLLNPWEYEG
ncbi:type II toxin-antitoxin system VapC family toxin [Streptomyces tsukubensis]|uniref:Ribonuclease VapC n=1 Tax=Streptomyces tsukubensis TaxID=83656 RepID=A0A1V4A4A0_9ACTN|nr:type II toxin-antitoxin system VapC family toxin [Streptomyces tsukubensis]OON74415.1 VapC toxin family PIN domain ribonuclease [Streptomyces tsukubensis]QFR95346.1 PIN domain-containing protein [Streptomyces tsukubensis]